MDLPLIRTNVCRLPCAKPLFNHTQFPADDTTGQMGMSIDFLMESKKAAPERYLRPEPAFGEKDATIWVPIYNNAKGQHFNPYSKFL